MFQLQTVSLFPRDDSIFTTFRAIFIQHHSKLIPATGQRHCWYEKQNRTDQIINEELSQLLTRTVHQFMGLGLCETQTQRCLSRPPDWIVPDSIWG